MVKVIVEDFTKNDVLVVNDQTLSEQGDEPPAPPADTNNHFGDILDERWGRSITNPESMYFSSKTFEHAAGDTDTVHIPDDPSLVGNPLVIGCGGPNACGNVRVKVNGETITKEYLTDPGSIQLTIAEDWLGQDVDFKFIDGHNQAAIQYSLLT